MQGFKIGDKVRVMDHVSSSYKGCTGVVTYCSGTQFDVDFSGDVLSYHISELELSTLPLPSTLKAPLVQPLDVTDRVKVTAVLSGFHRELGTVVQADYATGLYKVSFDTCGSVAVFTRGDLEPIHPTPPYQITPAQLQSADAFSQSLGKLYGDMALPTGAANADLTFPTKGSCNHQYVTYMGLNESFEYCKHCDIRKV